MQNPPPGHITHCDAVELSDAVELRKEPAGHVDTHAALSGDAYKPDAQGMHAVDAFMPDNGLNQPDGQDTPITRPANEQY